MSPILVFLIPAILAGIRDMSGTQNNQTAKMAGIGNTSIESMFPVPVSPIWTYGIGDPTV